MDDFKAIQTLGRDYREVRRVRLDQAAEKLQYLESWYSDMEKEATEFLNLQLSRAAEGTSPDHERLYNEISDRLAETLAGIRAAKENARCAFMHITTAMHYGPLTEMINHEEIDNESKEF